MVAQPIGSKKAVPSSTTRKSTATPVKRPAVNVKKTPVKAPVANTPLKKKPVTAVGAKKPLPPVSNYKKPATQAQKKIQSQGHIAVPQQQGYIGRALSGATSAISSATSYAATGIGNFSGAVVSAAGNGVAGAGKGAGSS